MRNQFYRENLLYIIKICEPSDFEEADPEEIIAEIPDLLVMLAGYQVNKSGEYVYVRYLLIGNI